MSHTRVPLKAWAFRRFGLILIQTPVGLEGEIWEGETLQALMKLGASTEAAAMQRLQQRAADLGPPPSLNQAPPSGRERSFVDRSGRLWHVSEAVSARWNWGQVADALRDRALLFDSDDEHCRLTKYPTNWADL